MKILPFTSKRAEIKTIDADVYFCKWLQYILIVGVNGAVIEFLVARRPIRILETGKFGLFDGIQDKLSLSVGKSGEESDIFFDVFAEHTHTHTENVILRSRDPGKWGLYDEADGF